MKIKKILIIVSAVLSFSSVHATNIDPTKATDAMAEAIARRLAGDGSLKIHALVVGKGGEGASLVGKTVSSAVVFRRGSVAREVVDGVRVALPVSKVSEEGVEFAPAAGKSLRA